MKISKAAFCLCILIPLNFAQAEDSLTVQVKETKMRSAPMQWSSPVSSLRYGDTISALKVENDWVKAKSKSNQSGFVHISALGTKKVILSSTKLSSSAVDPHDVVLAGKGFSKATEEEYSKRNISLNFKGVDAVQAAQVSDAELVAFMREGQIGSK